MNINNSIIKNNKGAILVNALVFGVISIMITSALVSWGSTVIKGGRQLLNKEQALDIAEAGIDYYRWHLAHNKTDFKDGTATSGPYIHDFKDKDGNTIGQYALTITPPQSGSTIVTLKSKGTVLADPNLSRTLEVRLAMPSFVKYAVVADDDMRFGEGTDIYGAVHSNGGVRFDGVARNLVTSSKDKYIDPDSPGPYRFGVYTTISPQDPNPPASLPNRPDVFTAGRQFPVPAVDFAGITSDLNSMKTLAQSSNRYFNDSGGEGYHVVLKTNDTFDLYKVTSQVNQNPCKSSSEPQNSGWSTWSIRNETFLANYSFPSNGIIFFDDDIWVNGQINGARLTIVAAHLPDQTTLRKNIIINNDILYTNYDGQDSLALIAQNNINIGLVSEDDLRIDGALVAQNGRVGRYYYYPTANCRPYDSRNSIFLFGSIMTNQRYGFAYTDGTGYETRTINYDGNLLYSPPPSFPLTSDQYAVISWKEVK